MKNEQQLSLFPHLRTDGEPKVITESDAKNEAARLLETLLEAGYVNVHQADVSENHLKDLIKSLKNE